MNFRNLHLTGSPVDWIRHGVEFLIYYSAMKKPLQKMMREARDEKPGLAVVLPYLVLIAVLAATFAYRVAMADPLY